MPRLNPANPVNLVFLFCSYIDWGTDIELTPEAGEVVLEFKPRWTESIHLFDHVIMLCFLDIKKKNKKSGIFKECFPWVLVFLSIRQTLRLSQVRRWRLTQKFHHGLNWLFRPHGCGPYFWRLREERCYLQTTMQWGPGCNHVSTQCF